MKVTKEYSEWYALLSLVHCYDEELRILFNCKKEEPDWQSEILDLGLEITEALESEDGRKRFVVNRYIGKGLNGQVVKAAIDAIFQEYSQQFGVIDGRAYF